MDVTENIGLKILIVLNLWLIPGLQVAQGQTSRNELVDTVVVADQSECAVIRVKFNLPVKYKAHFPEGAGKDLRVSLAPLAMTAEDRELTVRNEILAPPNSDIVEVAEIIYEGRDVVDPYLSIRFEHTMRFAVEQGDDFRSLIIKVFLPESKKECLQNLSESK